jgi:hypothetical protein
MSGMTYVSRATWPASVVIAGGTGIVVAGREVA